MSEAIPEHPLLETLNEQQRAAVVHFEGPALVIAGAGSGKTRTAVQRIAYLMDERGVLPQQILAVTFTNKAAGELKERVSELIGPPARDLWVATFHSACLRVLRSYGEHIDLDSGFGIYDDTDQLDVLKDILGSLRGMDDVNPRLLRALIDRSKSNMMSPEQLANEGERHFGGMVAGLQLEAVAEVYRLYQARLRQSNAVDFNDILGRTVELFESRPDVLERVRQRAVFIHVDEYQDTNAVQYRLTSQLAGEERNLMVIGDPDQSIYAFRGADVRNILDFQKDYPDASVYRLELNYRSIASVLDLANALIRHNQGRLEKELRPVKDPGEKVRIYRAADHRAEADFVARTVERLVAARDLSPADFAVLYRTNSQSRVIEEAMRRASIPAKIVGGVGFYERREVKDVLSYARAALNPSDDVAWRRILNRPKRGIGKTSEEKLASWASRKGLRFVDALRRVEEVLPGTAALKRISEFNELMNDLAEAAESLEAVHFLKAVLDQSGYMESLRNENTFEAQGRLENLDELLNAVVEWQDEGGGGTIGQFLDEAALMASLDDRAVKAVNDEVPEEAVTLMTLHNAKGLEFPVVLLVGLEENLIPHRSSTSSMQELEEERRLLYVGITRAQEELYLVHCESRMTFGRTEIARPSRFLEDVPRSLLCEVDLLGQELGDLARPSKFSHNVWRPPAGLAGPAGMSGAGAHAGDGAGGSGTGGAGANGSAQSSRSLVFRGGEKVRHPKFGLGTVVGVSGEGPKAQLTVIFEEAGTKRLLVRYANLSMA